MYIDLLIISNYTQAGIQTVKQWLVILRLLNWTWHFNTCWSHLTSCGIPCFGLFFNKKKRNLSMLSWCC